MENRKEHWENVYNTKTPEQVSWTQAKPKTSLDFIQRSGISKSDAIIDVGGGDSNLVDFLLADGYTNITVLDISEKAIERAKLRLGDLAKDVKWVVSDITEFTPEEKYALWHDRAAFHFLTKDEDKSKYIETCKSFVNTQVVIGTFSQEGPLKCSGIEIQRYTVASLSGILKPAFSLVSCLIEDHITPFDTEQNFIFCNFRKT